MVLIFGNLVVFGHAFFIVLEYIKFIVGVEAFLKEKTSMPKNEEIEAWHKIYNYIEDNRIIIVGIFSYSYGCWKNNEIYQWDFLVVVSSKQNCINQYNNNSPKFWIIKKPLF